MKNLIKKLRVTPKVAKVAGLRHLSHSEVCAALGLKSGVGLNKRDFSGIAFPGYDLDGNSRGVYQVRRDSPDYDAEGKPEAKYLNHAGSEGRYLYCLPLKKKDATVVLVESPKSVLALESYAERNNAKIQAVATNGCNGWKRRISDEVSVPLEDLNRLAGRDVLINFDSNVVTNPAVETAEKELATHLVNKVGAKSVRCIRLPLEEGVNGPDDYLSQRADKFYTARIEDAKEPWLLSGTFASYDDLVAAAEPDFLISPVLQDQGITFIGGLSGHGKTWILMSVMKALLSGDKLFGCFAVKQKAHRVLYLSPEVQLGQVKTRLEKFGLMEYVKAGRLLVRSLSEGPAKLLEPDILMAARGSVVVLDTAVRFADGNENDANANRDGLASRCFAVLEAGALTVIASHHAPKDLENASHLSLQNVMRGSGDIGAMLSGAWGVYQTNDTNNHVYVCNLKPRDMDKFEPFIIAGRPHINDSGDFKMLTQPGECPPFSECKPQKPKSGRKTEPENDDKLRFVKELVEAGEESPEKIAALINEKHGTNHKRATVYKWIRNVKRKF